MDHVCLFFVSVCVAVVVSERLELSLHPRRLQLSLMGCGGCAWDLMLPEQQQILGLRRRYGPGLRQRLRRTLDPWLGLRLRLWL